MSAQEMADKAGESDLGSEVKNVYQLIALVLAKYGMIGLVMVYFGFINWQQGNKIVQLTEKATSAAEQQTKAVEALTKAIERIEPRK